MPSSERGPQGFKPFARLMSCPTPGPTGHNDPADPLNWLRLGICRVFGNSPGPLGKNDRAEVLTDPTTPTNSQEKPVVIRWREFILRSVGRNGVNDVEDVCLIQERLNNHTRSPIPHLFVSGIVDEKTLRAIEGFQQRVVKLRNPDGLISPGGRTDRALAQTPRDLTKSGKSWKAWADAHAQNSHDVEKLAEPFRKNVKEFIAALKAGGASIDVQATRRDAKRAYLFHWSWKIALGKCKPEEATAMDGVDIEWDHGDLAKSKAGAKEMVEAFGLAVPPASNVAPAINSNHIAGNALDFEITWTGKKKFKKRDGTEMEIAFMTSANSNTALHELGESYDVKKHLTDEPHWSVNGR